jgi:hypothetical protein
MGTTPDQPLKSEHDSVCRMRLPHATGDGTLVMAESSQALPVKAASFGHASVAGLEAAGQQVLEAGSMGDKAATKYP